VFQPENISAFGFARPRPHFDDASCGDFT